MFDFEAQIKLVPQLFLSTSEIAEASAIKKFSNPERKQIIVSFFNFFFDSRNPLHDQEPDR